VFRQPPSYPRLGSVRHNSSQRSHERAFSSARSQIVDEEPQIHKEWSEAKREQANIHEGSEDSQTRGIRRPKPGITTYVDEELPSRIRAVMRHSPSSVVVITGITLKDERQVAISPRGNALSSNFRGMTVSSFTTITLTPEPIVCFNVKVPSRTFTAIEAMKMFRVHFLAGNDQGAFIANAFATCGKGGVDAFRILDAEGAEGGKCEGTAISVNRTSWRGLVPRIKGPGIRAVATCHVAPGQTPKIGDHHIVVAHVLKLAVEDDAPTGSGLMYSDGAYRSIGAEIEFPKDT